MNSILFKAIGIGAVLSATAARASLDFANLTGSSIEFAGGGISQFSITGPLDDQWQITSLGPAENLLGSFNGGPWNYGPISTLLGGVQVATVTGPTGTFSINDGHGFQATGNVNWVQLDTFLSVGGLNAAATVNITGMTYAGANTALQALVESGDGSVDLSFQFNPAESLMQLTTGPGPYDSQSYSGSFAAVVPEPTTVVAGALLLFPLAASTLRILRKHRAA